MESARKNYDIILFDLDGTLTDSGEGIMNGAAFALKKFGIQASDRSVLAKFVGPPLWESFEVFYGLTKEQSKQAVEEFRVYYTDIGILENQIYDGIKNLLADLHNAGKTIILATSKPKAFALRVLERFDIARYFTHFLGAEFDRSMTEKDQLITAGLSLCENADKKKAVMIGDRKFDIEGANIVGIDSIGVLYGYGDIEELSKEGATYIAKNADEIRKILL